MLLLLLLLLIATPLLADTAQDDDVLGVWFDPGASAACFQTSADYETVEGYVIVRGMSHDLLEGYALGLTVVDEGGLHDLSVTMSECTVNVLGGLEFMTAGCALAQEATHTLLTIQATVVQSSDPVYFYLRAIPERMHEPEPECMDTPCYYGEPGAVFALQHPEGDWALPVAAINDPDFCENVSDDDLPWGRVKTLYR